LSICPVCDKKYKQAFVILLGDAQIFFGGYLNMLVKRLLLVVLSFGIGFVVTVAVVYAPFIADTTLEEFGPIYTFFTALSFGLAAGIWLDKFLGTEILPK
jgi:hypothetical protein